MSIYADALRELAEPRPVGDLVKAAIGRAARLTGLSYTRAFDVWYGKARRIEAGEAERIAIALQKKRDEEARNEFHDLRARLLKMEARLAKTDPDIRGSAADYLRQQLRGRGRMGGAVGRAR